jgi:hypothetical protein
MMVSKMWGNHAALRMQLGSGSGSAGDVGDLGAVADSGDVGHLGDVEGSSLAEFDVVRMAVA